MTDSVRTVRPSGEEGEKIPLTRIGLSATPQIEVISATAYVLTKDSHGKILDFTSASAVAVTVPSGLPADFICGISQGGAGQVTLTASGVTISEPDAQLATEKQFVMLTLMAFSADAFRLYGRTA